jgi:rare lipoprotein A
MIQYQKSTLGTKTQSRTALAVFAATLLLGGGVTEASAKSRHHSHHASNASSSDANASMGSGRSFAGMASYYGNESGSKTASGQRMNANAMTCAHRSLPFGTKLRVTHGDRSVVVTVNDRGPFVRGRVLDLSTGAARAIGLTSAGVGRVTAEVVS